VSAPARVAAPPTYRPPPGLRDEAVAADGTPRAPYARLLPALQEADLGALAAGVTADARAARVPLHVDPVPRLLEEGEWAALAAGLEQRTRALAAFAADAHGERRAVAAGVVPPGLIESSLYFERDLLGAPPGAAGAVGVAGPDVVRAPGGELVVLEDNVRTPTLMAFAAIVRGSVLERLGDLAPAPPLDVEGPLARGLAALCAAEHPVVLGDGSDQAEAAWLARRLGLPHVTRRDLARAGDRLVVRAGRRPVDLVLRRTPEERLRTSAGGLTWLGEALLRPLRAGTLRVVNGFGAGVADDKRTYAYAEDLVRFFCAEEPLVRSIPTLDLGRPEHRAEALSRLDELVFKPRSGSGGRGLVLAPRATRHELGGLRAALDRTPSDWVAQPVVAFSTHPTVVAGRLAPRHVDLRAFVVGGRAIPGGLGRVALAAGDLVVSCSQGGGGKDTWVLPG